MSVKAELTPEQAEALNKALEVLVRANELGLLDTVKDLLDPEFIGRLSSLLLTPGTLKLLDHIDDILELLGSVDYEALKEKAPVLVEALKSLPKEPQPIGLLGLLKALSDPEVQRGLGVVLELLKALGRQGRK
ncbi:helical membrane plugin domain-containing protein [Infirmifilum sp. SLHALR2]